MSKIKIYSKISSKTNEEEIYDGVAIKKDNYILYNKNKCNISVLIDNKKVIFKRENNEIKLNMIFELNKKNNGEYILKEYSSNLAITTVTKKLKITNNSLEIEYDLYIDNEFSDTFFYIMKWSDI